MSLRESVVLAPLVIVAVLMGLFPKPFLDAINPTVEAYARTFRARAELHQLATVTPPRQRTPRINRGVGPARVAPPERQIRRAVQPRRRDGGIQPSPRLPWRRAIDQVRPQKRKGGQR